jgi:hypothetical protein
MLAYIASEDPTTISRERADLNVARGGGGGGGRGRGGPPSGRGSITLAGAPGGRGAGGGGRGAPTTDDKGWGLACPKAARFFNDTSRVTAPSNRP